MTSERRKERIETWMRAIVQDGGLERYDDLHIDRIDEAWKSRAVWLEAALEAFATAKRVRDDLDLDVVVSIAFSLIVDRDRPTGVDFATASALAQRLDHSPPSLYLFRSGREAWRLDERSPGLPIEFHLVALDIAQLFGGSVRATEAFLLEFKNDQDGDYARTVFLSG